MGRKKIIYVWKSPYPWDVRVEKICKSLTKEYDVLILARWGKEPQKIEQIDNITVRRVGYAQRSFLSTPLSFNPIWKRELCLAIKEFVPDLIIVREIMLGTLVGKIGKRHKIPVIMDMAENYPALMKIWHKYNDSLVKRLLMRTFKVPDRVEKSALRFLDGIIVVCKEQINRLYDKYSFPKNSIAIIKNTPAVSSQEYVTPQKQSKLTFLHHGWLTEEKKIDTFIKAFIRLYADSSRFELIVAGAGSCLGEYKKMASGISNISFTGEYNYNELQSVIARCSIGILPYEENDFNNYTIHNKLFDYFANSKPVLVSYAKPNARIVSQTDSGLVVDCSTVENLVACLEQERFTNLEQLSQNAYSAYRERYNWLEDEKTLLQFVRELI